GHCHTPPDVRVQHGIADDSLNLGFRTPGELSHRREAILERHPPFDLRWRRPFESGRKICGIQVRWLPGLLRVHLTTACPTELGVVREPRATARAEHRRAFSPAGVSSNT